MLFHISSNRPNVFHLHRSIVPVFLAFTIFMLVACGGTTSTNPSSQSSGPKSGGDIKVALNADVVTLDPLKSTALVDRQVMLNIYDTLVQVDEHNNIVPDLATSWSYKTPTQLIFTLRTGIKFHDGTPLNAQAVVFNMDRILKTIASPRHSELVTVTEVSAIDASHVQFTLKAPFAPLLATLSDRSGMILSPAVVQKGGDNFGSAALDAGSGAFSVVEWVKNDHLTVKRYPGYWLKDSQGNSLPYLQSIRYRPITDGTVEYNNLETGTVDVADTVDPNSVASAKANPGLIYKQAPGLSFFGFQLNTQVAPLNDVHVRRAIAWATNRQEILTSVLKGIGVLAQGPIAPSSWAFNSSFAPYSYDVNKAKAELAQAKTSGTVSFSMLVPSGSPLNLQEAQFIQAELQTAGIAMKIQQQTFATILSNTQAHNFQAALIGWSGRPDPDGNLYSWFHTGGGNNNMLYSNPTVDKLLEDARATSDQAQRSAAYQKAEQIIVQDASYIFINHGVVVQASTTKIKNFTLLPTGIMVFTAVSLA